MSIKDHIRNISISASKLNNHIDYLTQLKEKGFEPRVIYDIGSCVLEWTNQAKRIWPNARYILFDAFEPTQFLYEEGDYDYHIGVLSDVNDKTVRFYQNDIYPTGNSYYMEIGCPLKLFDENNYIEKKTTTLDTVVKNRGFPLPDLIKIDVQGSELDVIKGAQMCLKHASELIVEMQHDDYNKGAPKVDETRPYIESLGWKCVAPLYNNNGPDGDYGFTRV